MIPLDIKFNLLLAGESFQMEAQPMHDNWELQERRAFLSNFATTKGFDPLSAENWYSLSKPTLQAIYAEVHVLFSVLALTVFWLVRRVSGAILWRKFHNGIVAFIPRDWFGSKQISC